MKKHIIALLLAAFCLSASAQAPVLTVTGTSGSTYYVDVTLSPLSDGTLSHVFELCYMNPGSTVADVVQPANFCPDPLGFTGTATCCVWYMGIKAGAQVWVNQYSQPNPYQMGSYFWTLYNSVKDDRSKWLQSNVVTIQLPGSPAPSVNRTPPGKNKK